MQSSDSFRLDGRVALVTGGGRGIGEAMAVAFAEAGADVALVARTKEDLNGVAARIAELGRKAVPIAADLTDHSAMLDVVRRTMGEFARIDILANVAGVNRRVNVTDATPEIWDSVLDLNLRAVYFLCQAVGRIMIEQKRGKIINIASMTTFRGFSGLTPYVSSKTAIAGLTRGLAVEWAPHNIQVNAIAPGWIETPMTATMMPERIKWVVEHTPQRRFGKPRDVALLALYLASSASDFMTGQVLPIDGGFLAGSPWPEPQ